MFKSLSQYQLQDIHCIICQDLHNISCQDIHYNISCQDIHFNISCQDIHYNISCQDIHYNVRCQDIQYNFSCPCSSPHLSAGKSFKLTVTQEYKQTNKNTHEKQHTLPENSSQRKRSIRKSPLWGLHCYCKPFSGNQPAKTAIGNQNSQLQCFLVTEGPI